MWVYVPIPGVAEPGGLRAELVRVAERAGFVVVDLSDWAAGRGPTEVKLSDADRHPNALGQRLIADRLIDAVIQRPDLLRDAARSSVTLKTTRRCRGRAVEKQKPRAHTVRAGLRHDCGALTTSRWWS